jgi:hypothetical protein
MALCGLAGPLPDALTAMLSVLQVLAVALVWLAFVRRRPSAERLVLASAAGIAAFLAFKSFISPQYLVWRIPLVLLVPGRAGLATAGLLACSLVLGQIWFFHYRDVFALDRIVWLIVARDAALLCLYAVLLARLNTSTPSSEKTSRHWGLRRSRASPFAVARGSQRSA